MPRRLLLVSLVAALAAPVAARADLPMPTPVVDPTVAAARDTEPVILTGAAFGDWAVPANVTAKAPLTDLTRCQSFDDKCEHNHYEDPEADTATVTGDAVQGVDTSTLSGWRWDGARFVQVPLQVDEMFARYLNNSASGFSHYSGEDQHTAYAFDREGFRWTTSSPGNPCVATPDSPVAPDPVKGLDTNDEVVFMASDAGPAAPAGATLPYGAESVRAVEVRDPSLPNAPARVLYVMRGSVKPAFTAGNGYVRYERDANADTFELSESSYDGYGNAAEGVYCDEAGNVVRNADGSAKLGRRRPRDDAWVTTSRYKWRYDGRWLMTQVRISPDGGATYGPDLVDRWKARAFAQDPGSKTPCCGYEEEDTNWGGSSTLMGERVGPVRAIRETWGADSGTNVVRRETFYREEMRQLTFLRVHPIPPLDGIYAQWDFNAGRMTRYYNPRNPDGVAVDGKNDELVGNLDDPCNERFDGNDTGQVDQTYRSAYRQAGLCAEQIQDQNHSSVDPGDPTFNDANVGTGWSVTAGQWGSIVDRFSIQPDKTTPGGLAQSVVALPYYRDDACFDDGTGSDPGPKVNLRSGNEPSVAADGTARKCWAPGDGLPEGSDHYYQGSIGTHGVHLLFLVDSDNARQTVPVTEITTEQRMVMLPGEHGYLAGERYGRGFEKPLVAVTRDVTADYEPGEPPVEEPVVVATDTTYTGDTTGKPNKPVTLAARLVDAEGAPVVAATVTFTLGSVTASAVTGADGVATTTATYGGSEKPSQVTAAYAGDATHHPSSDAVAFGR